MKCLNGYRMKLVLVGFVVGVLFICPIENATQQSDEYVITVGYKQTSFVAQPEAGYVINAKKQAGNGALSSTLSFLSAENTIPIRSLDRHGIGIVEKKRLPGENLKTIKTLTTSSQIKYTAPLFLSNGETVAVIPEIIVRVTPEADVEQLGMACSMVGCNIKERMQFTEQEYLLEVLGPNADAVFTAVEQLNEISLLEHLQAQIKQANRWLIGVGNKDKRVKWLLTIPGIGRTIALLLVSEIDDITRFRSDRKLHAYAGLVPSTHSSAGRTFHGRIIKTGNKYIRWAMIEAVWPAIRSDAGLNNYFQRISRRKGVNQAKVCTARRLLTIVYKVLKEKREYRYLA